MAKASTAAEPSMEEILASIRRIISDDSPTAEAPPPAPAKPAAVKAAPAPKPVEEPATEEHFNQDDLDRLFAKGDEEEAPVEEEAVLDLVEEVAVPEAEPMVLVEGLMPHEADVQFVDPSELEMEPEPEPEPEPVIAPPSPAPKAAARKAPPPPPPPPVESFDEVDAGEPEEPLISAHAGASVNAAFGQLTHTILSAKAKTLDDLVKEMLRPMLKGWLDENLPVIVERLVRAEIERVSRGR